MSFTGVTYRNRNDSKTATAPKTHSRWVMASNSWDPKAHCMTFRWFKGLETSFFSRQLSWAAPLPGSLTSLSLF